MKQKNYSWNEKVDAENIIQQNPKEHFVKCSTMGCPRKYLISVEEYLDKRYGKPVVFLCPVCRYKGG